jgi:hypothetical protein
MVRRSPFCQKSMEQVLQGATESDLADEGQDEHDGQG